MLLARPAARRAAACCRAGKPTTGTRLVVGLGVRVPVAQRATPGWRPLASKSTISDAKLERSEGGQPSGLRSVASDVGRLFQLYRPERRTLGAAMTALVLSSGVTLAVPAGMGFVIDTVTHTHGEQGARPRVQNEAAAACSQPPHCRSVAGERGYWTDGAVRGGRCGQLRTLVPPQPRGSVRTSTPPPPATATPPPWGRDDPSGSGCG